MINSDILEHPRIKEAIQELKDAFNNHNLVTGDGEFHNYTISVMNFNKNIMKIIKEVHKNE